MNKAIYCGLVLAATLPLASFAEEATMTTTATTTQSGTLAPKGGMDGVTKALHIGMGKLSPTDRAELIKMIQDFLKSKGIEIPAEVKQVRQEVKALKKQTREEIKNMRKANQEAIKAKRETMRNDIKAKRDALKNGSGTTTTDSTATATSSGTTAQ